MHETDYLDVFSTKVLVNKGLVASLKSSSLVIDYDLNYVIKELKTPQEVFLKVVVEYDKKLGIYSVFFWYKTVVVACASTMYRNYIEVEKFINEVL